MAQKIKFVLGFSDFGGSTIAIMEQCKLLDSNGYDVDIYGVSIWPLSQYHKYKHVSELRIEPEDILIYHVTELENRPNCKLCLLYLHEKHIFRLIHRKVSGYDNFIFLNESQKQFHEKQNGFIVPNRFLSLVDPKQHFPPNKNIAGIVGTIQHRKQQHVSIQKALENNCSEVRLYGNYVSDYFDDYIKPLLSDRVIYCGHIDPKYRMKMYNEFDDLYHYSTDESSSLVVGECKILNKKVFKSEEVDDCEIFNDEKILTCWNKIFSCVEYFDLKSYNS
jgi:hypothetical protein